MNNSTDRAALILGLLSEDVAEDVLKRLKPELAEQLRQARKSRPATSANRRVQAGVIDDFDRFLRFVERQSGPELKVFPEDGDKPEKPARSRPKPSVPVSFDPDGDPDEALELVTEYQLAGAIEQEPPRAAALLLSVLPPRRTAEVLAHLSAEKRDKIVPELGREQFAPPQVVDRLMRTVLQQAVIIPPEGVERIDRVQRLADVMRAVDRTQRREMMKTLEEHDADTATAVSERLFIWDDIGLANDRTVQRLLMEVDSSILACALSGAEESIAEKIFSNLSRRAQASLREELELQPQLTAAEIDAARREVVKALGRVEQDSE